MIQERAGGQPEKHRRVAGGRESRARAAGRPGCVRRHRLRGTALETERPRRSPTRTAQKYALKINTPAHQGTGRGGGGAHAQCWAMERPMEKLCVERKKQKKRRQLNKTSKPPPPGPNCLQRRPRPCTRAPRKSVGTKEQPDPCLCGCLLLLLLPPPPHATTGSSTSTRTRTN